MKNNLNPKIKEMSEKYNKPYDQFLMRMDGRCEWLCQHGVGHTVWYPKGSSGSHGCCGCCSKELKNG